MARHNVEGHKSSRNDDASRRGAKGCAQVRSPPSFCRTWGHHTQCRKERSGDCKHCCKRPCGQKRLKRLVMVLRTSAEEETPEPCDPHQRWCPNRTPNGARHQATIAGLTLPKLIANRCTACLKLGCMAASRHFHIHIHKEIRRLVTHCSPRLVWGLQVGIGAVDICSRLWFSVRLEGQRGSVVDLRGVSGQGLQGKTLCNCDQQDWRATGTGLLPADGLCGCWPWEHGTGVGKGTDQGVECVSCFPDGFKSRV